MLRVLVSARPVSRDVPTNFPETFPQSGNCPSSGGDTRFSCEGADQL